MGWGLEKQRHKGKPRGDAPIFSYIMANKAQTVSLAGG